MTKKLFGIIGNPIKHTLSPILHNYWFQKYKIDASYSIIEADEKNLAFIIKKIKDKSLSGINVTLPFKQKVINHIDKIINDAQTTGSANTVFLDNKSLVVGENTDVFGLLVPVVSHLL
jgi:shikimate dehydrogenase